MNQLCRYTFWNSTESSSGRYKVHDGNVLPCMHLHIYTFMYTEWIFVYFHRGGYTDNAEL